MENNDCKELEDMNKKKQTHIQIRYRIYSIYTHGKCCLTGPQLCQLDSPKTFFSSKASTCSETVGFEKHSLPIF